MQVPPVPQIQNDLLRPQAGSKSPSSVAEALSKKPSQDVKARFSDHLNDERRLPSDSLTDRPKEAGSQPSSAERPSSASESSPQGAPQDGAIENESQAEIADSSQEVPSDRSEGPRQTKARSDAEDSAPSDTTVADAIVSTPDTESILPVESSADLDTTSDVASDSTIISTIPVASVASPVPADGTGAGTVQGQPIAEEVVFANRLSPVTDGDGSQSNQSSRLDGNTTVTSGAERASATPPDTLKTNRNLNRNPSCRFLAICNER